MRSHGRFDSSAWRDDDDWRSLPVDAQWLYMAMISQSDLTLAGVLHISRRRWSKLAADIDVGRLNEAIKTCSDRRFIVVDEDTEEVLVRSFARRETQWSNSRRVGGLRSAVEMIQSGVILDALQAELARVNRRTDGTPIDPGSTNRSGNRLDDVRPIITTNTLPESFDQSIAPSGSDVSRLPSPVVLSSVVGSVGESAKPRGTRIKTPFVITDEMKAWAISRGITKAQAEHSTEIFENHWKAATKNATKLDWFATWRNWLMRDYPDSKPFESEGARLNREMGLS